MVVEVGQSNITEAEKNFKSVSKMAVDSNIPSHVRKLGQVLQRLMSGVKSPDLSGLPEEIREIVKSELGI